ncbi:hypothetical protein BCR33DRAFT_712724 [Rhizoclosmatium globosum]|uniref:HbrB-domain-containing protein n=1 Tax=Rhizoclosmatium globosum TaxID=329046 RepID=A0A1Y2CUK6_9FUNG|nr:hypothetical protein BCR33DRAFT_712724 [Rhizoclosmatium globosum]|eukprot:ORY50729.1 hypothetical protein BCR33DRAFT_712724 [Rhizoclosmatium globosum]
MSMSRQKSNQGSSSNPNIAMPNQPTPQMPAVPTNQPTSANTNTGKGWWPSPNLAAGKTPNSSGNNSVGDSNNHINVDYSMSSGVSDAAAWRELRMRVLPLFSGEGLKGSIEELNDAVTDWLNESAARSTNIRADLNELVQNGAVILGKKMVIAGEETLVPRLLDLWSFFFATVVPYMQGSFVPLKERLKQTEGPAVAATLDVRTLTLIAFRDQIVIPYSGRLEAILPILFAELSEKRFIDISSRSIQMFSVLQSVRSKPNDEKAKKCQQLLQLVRDCVRRHDEAVAKVAKLQQKEKEQLEASGGVTVR